LMKTSESKLKNCMTKQCMQSNGEYNHTVTKFFM
jgi:hypothetical protein